MLFKHLICAFVVTTGLVAASPVNPDSHRIAFENAKKDAEVVAKVRVVTVVCTESDKSGDKVGNVTLQLALQIEEVEKGTVKKNELVIVTHKFAMPTSPGPGSYGYLAALHRFPFSPGETGSVALNWDKDSRRYVAVSGWVAKPIGAEIPVEVGKVISAKDK